MTMAISEFSFQGQGTTRDATLMAADALAIDILDKIGGQPWVMVDDDVDRISAPGAALADDQGYLYVAKRRYVFAGPVKESPDMKPGMQIQKGDDNGQG